MSSTGYWRRFLRNRTVLWGTALALVALIVGVFSTAAAAAPVNPLGRTSATTVPAGMTPAQYAAALAKFPASDWIDRAEVGKKPITLTKPEYGYPAGTTIMPPVQQPNCNQPTAAARAADLAGTLTKAQAYYYGLPLRSEFPKDANGQQQFVTTVTHALHRGCTYFPTVGTKVPTTRSRTTQSASKPLLSTGPKPLNEHWPTSGMAWDCLQWVYTPCWAGYVSQDSHPNEVYARGYGAFNLANMWNEYDCNDPLLDTTELGQWVGIGGYNSGDSDLLQTGVYYREYQITCIPEVEVDSYHGFIEQVTRGYPNDLSKCVNSCSAVELDLDEYVRGILTRVTQSGDEIIAFTDYSNEYHLEDVPNYTYYDAYFGNETPGDETYECVVEQLDSNNSYMTTTSGLFFSNCHGVDESSDTYYMGDNSNAWDYHEIDVCDSILDQDIYPGSPHPSSYGNFTIYNKNTWHC
jgi:hypothetical protein